MPGKEIAVPEGRAVSAPETPGGGHSSKTVGAIPVRLVAQSLNATVVVNPTAPAAYAVIGGDKHDDVVIAWENGCWTLRWPEGAGVYSTGFVFGNIQVRNFGRGSTFVNGVHIDNLMGAHAVEQPVVHLILPSGCSLDAELQSGDIEIPATPDERHGLTRASLSSQSGSLYAGCAVGEVSLNTQSGSLSVEGYTGPVTANTMSGNIELAHAAGNVQAQTISGYVSIHCEESIWVSAASTSGSVRVTAAHGAVPTGSGSSVSSSVSVPPSMSGGSRRRRGW